MNLTFLKQVWITIFNHFRKNWPTYAKVGGAMVFASAVTAVACDKAYKKIEDKHRKKDAEKYKAEFAKSLKKIEERYQHNEYLLKKKINELCDEFGIDHVC